MSAQAWGCFWDLLQDGDSRGLCERAPPLLRSLMAQVPDAVSVEAFLDSLDARHARPAAQEAANIVGTGGGPSTFNISTAAAFLAGTLGARVVKSGSRAHRSRYGSIDMLELLGVPLTSSHEATAEAVGRFGIAFTGSFVYPPELRRLARSVGALERRRLGRLFNRIGPFMAALPATCQLTGVADRSALPLLEHLSANHCWRRVWLCFNRLGVDELVSFEENVIRPNDGPQLRLMPATLALGAGTLADLRPVVGRAGARRQFTALLAGEGPPAALESVCLNAAALLIASELACDWDDAFGSAKHALERGYPLALLQRLVR
jgi:anthranilate phosphoribosyltransferase